MYVLVFLLFTKLNNYPPKLSSQFSLPNCTQLRSETRRSQICSERDEMFQSVKGQITFAQGCAEFVWYFPSFSLRVAPGKLKPLPRAAGLYELCSLLALAVIVECTCILRIYLSLKIKKLMFIFIVFFWRTENGLRRRWIHLYITRWTKDEIEIHKEFKWLYNTGNRNKIRILISQLLIKMVAIYLTLAF